MPETRIPMEAIHAAEAAVRDGVRIRLGENAIALAAQGQPLMLSGVEAEHAARLAVMAAAPLVRADERARIAADAVLAVRDDELARALRIADYHAGQHQQAAHAIARVHQVCRQALATPDAPDRWAVAAQVRAALEGPEPQTGAGAVSEEQPHAEPSHWGPDPGHSGLTRHTGAPEDCPGPDCGPSASEEQTGGGEAEPAPGTYWERSVLERFVTGGPVDMATVRQQVAALLGEIPARRPGSETGGDDA